jgi:hypothetical protein
MLFAEKHFIESTFLDPISVAMNDNLLIVFYFHQMITDIYTNKQTNTISIAYRFLFFLSGLKEREREKIEDIYYTKGRERENNSMFRCVFLAFRTGLTIFLTFFFTLRNECEASRTSVRDYSEGDIIQ